MHRGSGPHNGGGSGIFNDMMGGIAIEDPPGKVERISLTFAILMATNCALETFSNRA